MERRKCNVSEGDVQCHWVTPNGNSCKCLTEKLFCGLVEGHEGEHEDCYGYSNKPWYENPEYLRMERIKKDIALIVEPFYDGDVILRKLEEEVFSNYGDY